MVNKKGQEWRKVGGNCQWFWWERNLCRCEVGLTKWVKKKRTNLRNWLKFIDTFKYMHNDVDTYMERNREWKKKLITLSDMPWMSTKELHIYF